MLPNSNAPSCSLRTGVVIVMVAIASSLWLYAVAPKILTFCSGTKASTTRIALQQIADEAFPMWSVDQGRNCPRALSELNKYRNSKSTADGWGTEIRMLCKSDVPRAAAHGFAVLSAGPDRKFGTSDDIRSWEAVRRRRFHVCHTRA